MWDSAATAAIGLLRSAQTAFRQQPLGRFDERPSDKPGAVGTGTQP